MRVKFAGISLAFLLIGCAVDTPPPPAPTAVPPPNYSQTDERLPEGAVLIYQNNNGYTPVRVFRIEQCVFGEEKPFGGQQWLLSRDLGFDCD